MKGIYRHGTLAAGGALALALTFAPISSQMAQERVESNRKASSAGR